jgi:predicted metal-dependent hydrolase
MIAAWYREKAINRLIEKIEKYSKRLCEKAQSVKVSDYRSRWGSCILPSTVSFNWRIVMVPQKIIDYVVVHELCHLKHHDHSEKFWSLVRRVIPKYASHRQWLVVAAMRSDWIYRRRGQDQAAA